MGSAFQSPAAGVPDLRSEGRIPPIPEDAPARPACASRPLGSGLRRAGGRKGQRPGRTNAQGLRGEGPAALLFGAREAEAHRRQPRHCGRPPRKRALVHLRVRRLRPAGRHLAVEAERAAPVLRRRRGRCCSPTRPTVWAGKEPKAASSSPRANTRTGRGSRGRWTKEVWYRTRAWAWRPAGSNAGRPCRPAALSPNRAAPPLPVVPVHPRVPDTIARPSSTPAARGKAILCSQQSLKRVVEDARAGMTKGHFPSDGVATRAATLLFSDGAVNNECPCRAGQRAHGVPEHVLCSTAGIRGVSVSVR